LRQGKDIQARMLNLERNIQQQQALSGKWIIRVADYFIEKERHQGLLQKILEEEYIDGQSIYMQPPQLLSPSAKLLAFTSFIKKKSVAGDQMTGKLTLTNNPPNEDREKLSSPWCKVIILLTSVRPSPAPLPCC